MEKSIFSERNKPKPFSANCLKARPKDSLDWYYHAAYNKSPVSMQLLCLHRYFQAAGSAKGDSDDAATIVGLVTF